MYLRFWKALRLSGAALLLPGGLMLLSGALISGPVSARCLNTTTGIEVTASTGQPTSSGQSVVCDTTAPNPTAGTTSITGAPLSTGVSVTVLPGSIVASNARAIGVVNASTVLNRGTVRTTLTNAYGISASGSGSTLSNEGTITTTGTNSHGLNAGLSGTVGANTIFVNRGTITVNGNLAHGVRSIETSAGTKLTNSGTITARFSNGNGVVMNGGSVINEAGGSISGGLAGIQFVGAFDNSVINSGNIAGGLGAVDMGAGNDAFTSAGNSTVNGTVDGGTGSDAFTFDRTNDATIAHGIVNFEALTKNGANTVTLDANVSLSAGGVTMINTGTLAIASGRSLSSTSITAPGSGTVTLQNGGQITGNVLFGSAGATGTYTLNNLASGTVQGTFQFQGNGSTAFIHAGTLNGNIFGSGAGTFLFENSGNFNGGITINGSGANTINNLAGHTINGAVNITGAQNAIENAGTFNQGLVLTGSSSNSVTNRAGAFINQTFSITGDGQNTVDNAGTINNGLTLNGNGTNLITNLSGATINQNIVSNGEARDTVDNVGLINNSILLNAGDDVVINRTGAEVNLEELGRQTVNGVIDTGAGADRFFMLGGRVNNQVLLGPDSDIAEISDGVITQFVRAQDGSDQLLWTGGNIGGLDMGTQDDVATLLNMTTANLTPGLSIDGGLGSDQLIWDHTVSDGVARYTNWETFQLTNASQLTFSSTLALGDAGTGTGTLSIDPTSTAFAGNGGHSIVPFTTGQLVTVNNAGTINLTNGAAAATDTLTIVGNYIGHGGKLQLQTVLGTDGSLSDRLVLQSGAGSGATGISVTNLGGPGDLTTANGIQVVAATNGTTTTPGAFTLDDPVGAGIFEYLLFRGGVTPGADNDWFLRSAAPPSPPPPPGPPSPPEPPGTPPPAPPPGTPPEPAAVPLIRPEIPGYTIAPTMARQMGIAAIGTFHQRRGDQSLLIGNGAITTSAAFAMAGSQGDQTLSGRSGSPPAAWGRIFGSAYEEQWSPTIAGLDFQLSPEFDGHLWGLQAGLDLVGFEHEGGGQDRVGLFYTHTEATGDITGFTLGTPNNPSGEVDLNGDSIAAYWTHIGASGWYVDAIAMHTWLDGDATSDRDIGAELDGNVFAASLEGGYPFALGSGWTLEPQAQVIWQHIDLDDTRDPFTSIDYDAIDAFTGRIGARLEANLQVGTTPLQPFLDVNLWHNFSATDTIVFNTRAVVLDAEGTVLEVGGGSSATLTPSLSVYGEARYGTGLDDDDDTETVSGSIGLRLQW